MLGGGGLNITDEWGARCTNVTICLHYLLIVLQIGPIDYGDYITTCKIMGSILQPL